MVWNPDAIGGRDDSFLGGGWVPIPMSDYELLYLLNENTGSKADDESPNNRDGDLSGGYSWVSAKYRYAIHFNGVDAVLDTNYSFTILATSIWTFLLRVKADAGATGVFMGTGKTGLAGGEWNRVQLNFNTNKCRVYVKDDSAVIAANFTGTVTIADGAEHTIMLIVDPNSDKVELYVDGVLDTEVNNAFGQITLDTTTMGFGALISQGAPSNYAHCEIDEPGILSRRVQLSEFQKYNQFGASLEGGYDCDVDVLEGDLARLTLWTGKTSGYIEKSGISVNAATFKYLVLGVFGDGDYFIEVYDGVWKTAKSLGDAPDTYDVVVIDLSGITTGTVTKIRLGVGSTGGKKTTYDFFEFHSAQPAEPADVSSMRVLQREGEADYFRSDWLEGASDPFTKGHYIRIIAGRESNVEKIFAGVIEESNLKGGKIREVAGRCFQVKVQAATETKTFTNRELSLAVKDLILAFTEITTGRVKSPSPVISISKEYVDAHVSDVLDQLASIPSKQSPYDAWMWKVGYGQDLRFRSEVDSDVLTCGTSISEGTNLLAGVKKGSDLYELCNKVKAISGFVQYPGSDGWCEDAAGWSIYHGTRWDETTKGLIRVGMKSIKVVYTGEGPPYDWYVYRTFTAKNMTAYQRILLWFRLGTGWKAGTNTMEIRCYSAGGGYWYYMIDDSNNEREDNAWHNIQIDLDDPNWEKSGDPSWTDINEIRLFWLTGSLWTGNVWFDGLCFEVDNMECVASDTSSPVKGDRVLVYKDEKINDVEKLQDLADGLLRVVKAAAERIMLPVVGAPDLQSGRKVTATSSTFGLSGSYVIAEAEHVLDRSVGYVTTVLLDRSRYALPADLRRTLERELRRETLGTVTVV